MLSDACEKGLLCVENFGRHKFIANPDFVRHPELKTFLELAKLPSRREGDLASCLDRFDDYLSGDYLNISVGTLGSGRLCAGQVYGGGLGITDGEQSSRVILGPYFGREVLVERTYGFRFVESFAEGTIASKIGDDELALRLIETRKQHPDLCKQELLEQTGVATLKQVSQREIWKYAKVLAPSHGVEMPGRGRPRKS